MRSRVLAVLALVLALVGLGASVASLFDYLSPAPTFCSTTGCATVRASEWSHLAGIPLPAFGIVYFVVMGVLAFLPRRRTRIALAAIGAGVGVGLILIQAFAIGAWCKLCLIADPAAIAGALVIVGGAGTLRATWPNIAATLPAGALVVLGLGLYAHRPIASVAVPDFVTREQKPGTVTIVEFVDFECPYCRAMNEQLTDALGKTRKPVRIVRKMVPLPGHPHAVPAAMAWVAADAQGKGDEMAQALFTAKPEDLTPAGCEALAVKLGCEVMKYRETFASQELQSRIKQDVLDGQKLNGLPTIFIGTQKFEGSDHPSDRLLAAIEAAAKNLD